MLYISNFFNNSFLYILYLCNQLLLLLIFVYSLIYHIYEYMFIDLFLLFNLVIYVHTLLSSLFINILTNLLFLTKRNHLLHSYVLCYKVWLQRNCIYSHHLSWFKRICAYVHRSICCLHFVFIPYALDLFTGHSK